MDEKDRLRDELDQERAARRQSEDAAERVLRHLREVEGHLRVLDEYVGADLPGAPAEALRAAKEAAVKAEEKVAGGTAPSGAEDDKPGAAGAKAGAEGGRPPVLLDGAFLSEARHAILGALGGARGFLELLRAGRLRNETERQAALDNVALSARQTDLLLEELFDALELGLGKVRSEPEPLQLREEVRRAMERARDQARTRTTFDLTGDVPGEVRLDRRRVRLALEGLLANAARTAPDDQTVQVRIVDGETVRVEASFPDPDASLEEAKRPFHAHEGLPSLERVRLAALAEGGRAGGEVKDGRVVLFVELPRTTGEPAPAEERPQRPAKAKAPARRRTSDESTRAGGGSARAGGSTGPQGESTRSVEEEERPRVLVVEDDDDERRRLHEDLHAAGYDVTTAANVEEAVGEIRRSVFDAVTLDLLLGREYSLDVLRTLRTEGPNRETPTLVVSVASPGNVAFPYPVQGHLQKPLTKRTLLRALTWVGVPPTVPGPVLLVAEEPPPPTLPQNLEQAGYRLVEAVDEEEATALLDEEAPDAVVLDSTVPLSERFLQQLEVPLVIWGPENADEDLQSRAQAVLERTQETDDLVAELLEILREQAAVEEGHAR